MHKCIIYISFGLLQYSTSSDQAGLLGMEQRTSCIHVWQPYGSQRYRLCVRESGQGHLGVCVEVNDPLWVGVVI